jgi:ABC-2 type transport system permease protein
MSVSFRKYIKTGAMTATGYFGDSPLFALDYLLIIVRVIVLMSIWRMIFTGRGEVGGMSLAMTLTYTIVSVIFGGLFTFHTTLADDFWDGRLATRFLRPMHIFMQYIVEALGTWAVNFCLLSVPLYCAAPLFGVNPLPRSVIHAGWFIVSLVLAVGVGAAIDLFFAALVVIFGNGAYAINRVRRAVSLLLSGAVLPLALLPWKIGDIFAWLPFAATASAPLRIYTGTGNPAMLIVMQLGWLVVLGLTAHWFWKSQQERLVSYGG